MITARPASSQLEYKDPWTGRPSSAGVDPFSDNFAVDHVRRVLPSATFEGPAPTMFASGALPAITASGAPPETLRLLHWRLRHAGAFVQTRVGLLRLLEQQDDELSRERLLDRNREGKAQLADYLARVRAWAITAPPPEELTDEDMANLFGPPAT